MPIDSNGLQYENRTLNFYGYAYGNSNVTLTATINGTSVFSGEVPTIDSQIPPPPNDVSNASVLFSIADSTIFPTNWSGSLPMSITVTGGYGAVFGAIDSNWMVTVVPPIPAVMENATIEGTTLTIGSLTSGTVEVGQFLLGTGLVANTQITSGSGSSWTVNNTQSVPATTITGRLFQQIPGTANVYLPCYNGTPVNSESTPDSRSSVTIDGITQVPPLPVSTAVWTWVVPTGSTLSYNLNVSLGSCGVPQ